MGMTQTSTAPANIVEISGWTNPPRRSDAHRTDIKLREPATYAEATALANRMIRDHGYDPNGFVFITH